MARSAMYVDWLSATRAGGSQTGQLSVKVPPASKGKDCVTSGRLAIRAETKVL